MLTATYHGVNGAFQGSISALEGYALDSNMEGPVWDAIKGAADSVGDAAKKALNAITGGASRAMDAVGNVAQQGCELVNSVPAGVPYVSSAQAACNQTFPPGGAPAQGHAGRTAIGDKIRAGMAAANQTKTFNIPGVGQVSAASIQRYNTTRKKWILYAPAGMNGLGGLGSMSLGEAPPGYVKVAESETPFPNVQQAGTEEGDDRPWYKKPLIWAGIGGGVVVLGTVLYLVFS